MSTVTNERYRVDGLPLTGAPIHRPAIPFEICSPAGALPMGLMRFLVPRRDRLAPDAIDRAYCSGMDSIPWQSRTQWTDEGLAIRRSEHDSGCFNIPWRVAGRGELLLATATLMERDKPYHLTVELARGSINRLRNQMAVWQSMGLVVSEPTCRKISQALEHLSRAATGQAEPAPADVDAQQALEMALVATAELGREYAEQSLAARRRQESKSTTLLGINLGSVPLADDLLRPLAGIFNTANVQLCWREVERLEGQRDWSVADRQIDWCRSKGLKVAAGPLLQFDRCATPDWLYLWEGDDDNLMAMASDYIRAAVTRYRGKVQLWQCAARLNAAEVFSLSEEQRLRLAVLAIEVTRQTDPRAPIVLSIDQPWAEFMSENECDLSPLHFADALVRAEIGLAGLALEINLGYWPGGSALRDVLEFGRLLDRWSLLGLPLLVMLTLPSSTAPDPLARCPVPPRAYAAGGVTPESQREWIEQFMPMLLAKQPVQAIVWNQVSDSVAHDFPHAGLFDAAGQPKPAVEAFKTLRQQYFG